MECKTDFHCPRNTPRRRNKILGKILNQAVLCVGQQVASESLGCQLKQRVLISVQDKGSLWVNAWGDRVTAGLYLNTS